MDKLLRTMERLEWANVLDRSYTYGTYDGVDGAIGLIRFNEVGHGVFRDYGDKKVTVYDKDCYWFQIAYRAQKRWLTVLFYPDGTFAQAYFDITEYNKIMPNGKSEFKDIYLDVVVMTDGKTYLLDEDEILNALKAGKITQTQYDEAYAEAREIISEYNGNADGLIDLCTKCFNKLVSDIDRSALHTMHLDDVYFNKIKNGEKTFEIRLNTEDRRKINAADRIEFINRSTDEKIMVKVNDIYIKSTVSELASDINPKDAGFENVEQMAEKVNNIYSKEEIEEYGICAFKIKRI